MPRVPSAAGCRPGAGLTRGRAAADTPGSPSLPRPVPLVEAPVNLTWLVVMLAALLLWPLVGRLVTLAVAALFGRSIGARSLAAQPDAIHLDPAAADAFADRAAAERATAAIAALGFRDGGTFTVREMPGVVVRLLAEPGAGWYAAVMEHPQAGAWFEFVSRFEDGTAATFSTLPATGLAERPGFVSVHAPGATVEALWRRACRERPERHLRPHRPERAAADFTAAYAESIGWRKAKGVSAAEVVEVAKRRAA